MKTDDGNPTASSASHPSAREKYATGLESRQRRDSPHRSTSRTVRSGSVEPNPRQAAQLTEYLQQRIQELDRREANFHAQVASWEQECRHWRNKVEQCEQELNTRQEQLAAEQQVSQRQVAALAMDQVSWEQEIKDRKESCQDEQETLLQLKDLLQRQQEEIQRRRKELHEEQVQWALQYEQERRQVCDQRANDQEDAREE